MMVGLFWIIGIYALGFLLIHWSYRRLKSKRIEQPLHYVLITHNHQSQVEWHIRSLLWLSWLKGRTIKLTIADEGSTDDTLAILQKLAAHYAFQLVHASGWNGDEWLYDHEQEQVIVVRLKQSHDESLEAAYKWL